MRARYSSWAFAVVLLVGAALTGTLQAGTATSGGITLTYPEYPLNGPGLSSCEPGEEATANSITLTGLTIGSTVAVQFVWSSPYGGSLNFLPLVTYPNVGEETLIAPVQYPSESSQWPVYNTTTNERAIAVGVMVRVTKPDGTVVKLTGKTWWVRCLPPPRPAEGCTPGYWRQEQHFDSWVGYLQTDLFGAVFGVSPTFDPNTLLDAVWLGGGGENALARHAVAAILNASNPNVNYSYTTSQIIAGVQNAYQTGDFEPFKDALDLANNAGCPLN